MHVIEKQLLELISTFTHKRLFIAYSGGVDSQVLLHALVKILNLKAQAVNPMAITVCHIHHGLSPNADSWLDFAMCESKKLDVKFLTERVVVSKQTGKGIEANAREARYQALIKMTEPGDLILTGHHQDDQLETMLLALKRGAGLKGLSAMDSQRYLSNRLLVRPLLNISRHQIELYAHDNDLTWIEDESNVETKFDRNFLRQKVIPLLKNRWPSITATFSRSAEHCRDAENLLLEVADQDFSQCCVEDDCFSIDSLLALSKSRFNNLIRYFLEQNHCIMPSSEQLSQLHLQLAAADDKNPAVKVGQYYLRRFKGRLFLTADFEDVSEWQTDLLLAKTSSKVVLPNKLGKVNCVITTANEVDENSQYLKLPKPGQKITISFTHTNPKCLPDYRQHSRSLKKVLQELAIPPWQRKRIPFLYYDDTLVAAVGLFVCQAYMANSKKHPLSQKIETTEPSVKITWAQ